jgi:hypothetical protein
MKKLILALLFCLIASPAMALDITSVTIADGLTAVAAGHSYSPVSVNCSTLEGYFALQGRIAGDGTAKIEYWTSSDGTTYREPTGATDIISGFTKTSGPASDGRFFIQFAPDFCKYLKIVITETGGVSTITPTITLIKR